MHALQPLRYFEASFNRGWNISPLKKENLKKEYWETTTIWNLYNFYFLSLSFHSIIFRFYSTNVFEYLCVLFFSSVSIIYFFVFLLIYCSKIQSRQADCHWIYIHTCKMFNARAIKYSCFILRAFVNLQLFRKHVKLKKMAALNFGHLMKHVRATAQVSFA